MQTSRGHGRTRCLQLFFFFVVAYVAKQVTVIKWKVCGGDELVSSISTYTRKKQNASFSI